MTDHCIIKADFCNFRPVAGRKVLQLYFEVPMEEGDEALRRLGGMPQPGSSRWCAIALLDTKSSEKTSCAQREPVVSGEQQRNTVGVTAGETAPQDPEGGGSTQKWSDYTRSQQAAILCDDPAFQAYFGCGNEPLQITVAEKLRQHFRIKSRAELDRPDNHARWDEFCALYQLHRQRLP